MIVYLEQGLETQKTRKFVIQITGSRTWKNPHPIREKLKEYVEAYGAGNLILRHGNARGADVLSGVIAKKLGIEVQARNVEYYGFSWNAGRDAGQKRNEAMLDEEPKPDVVLAFPNEESIGTWNMIKSAKERKIDIWVYPTFHNLSHNEIY